MKKIFLIISLNILSLITLNADPAHTYEAMFTLINYGSSWNVKFTFEAASTRWDENFNFTNDYTYGEQTIVQPKSHTGFDFVTDILAGENPVMALGLYKITAYEYNVETAWFYLDLRTSDMGSSPDIYFYYDVANNRFMNHENTININATTQTLWDLVEGISQVTSNFETSVPQNNSVTNYFGNPKLTWQRLLNDDYVTGYDIYRSFSSPNVGFSKIGSTTNLSFIDNEINVGSGSYVYYRVKAINGTRVSDYSNVTSIMFNGLQKNGFDTENNESIVYDFNLFQNYPNPFNPSTTIKYSLKESGFVEIKIFDLLRNELRTLLNKIQSEGLYEIKFDAYDLPSGIYIYQLHQNNFKVSKKLTLIK